MQSLTLHRSYGKVFIKSAYFAFKFVTSVAHAKVLFLSQHFQDRKLVQNKAVIYGGIVKTMRCIPFSISVSSLNQNSSAYLPNFVINFNRQNEHKMDGAFVSARRCYINLQLCRVQKGTSSTKSAAQQFAYIRNEPLVLSQRFCEENDRTIISFPRSKVFKCDKCLSRSFDPHQNW